MSEQKAMLPERIWVQWPNVNGCGLAFNTPANPRHKSDDRFDKRTPYILATPTALAASPEVAKLIAAEAKLWERAIANYCDLITIEDVEDYVAKARAEAAAGGDA